MHYGHESLGEPKVIDYEVSSPLCSSLRPRTSLWMLSIALVVPGTAVRTPCVSNQCDVVHGICAILL